MSLTSSTPCEISLIDALQRITKSDYKYSIQLLRKTSEKNHRDTLKKSLPAFVFGGNFADRKTLMEPSGLACLDFDKVISLNRLYNELRKSKYILSFWLSPSGNGVKALVRIPLVKSKEKYKEYYKAILSHFKALYPMKALRI